MSYFEYINSDLSKKSVSELEDLQRKVMAEYDATIFAYASEVKKFDTPNFDPYSWRGDRKLKKAASKYADDIATMESFLDEIDSELNLRIERQDMQDFLNNPEEETEEDREKFLEREEFKTERIRKSNKV